MPARRYTDEQLRDAVASSASWAEVLRKLGIRQAGGSQSYMKNRAKNMGLDTSHFRGQGHARGKTFEVRRLKPEDVFVTLPEGSPRTRHAHLKRAMLESGFEYKCGRCGLTEWMGAPITLDVDHIDGNWLNNLPENLRFLCPNCHSQTDTFGNKKRA